jgi:hypothetical protein
MPGSARSRRREEERQRDRGGAELALPQRQPRLRVRPPTPPRPQTHPSTPSKDRAGAAAPRCAAGLGVWEGVSRGRGSCRADKKESQGAAESGASPSPPWGIRSSPPRAPCLAGPCWVGSPRPRRSGAQWRPPAAARNPHPPAIPVRPALPRPHPASGRALAAAAGPWVQ